jgi:hypothetical protein
MAAAQQTENGTSNCSSAHRHMLVAPNTKGRVDDYAQGPPMS